jgi:DNA polymerase theta
VQVHDELLFEVSSDQLAEAVRLIRGVMEAASGVWGLQVLLPIKLSVGPSWGQLQDYQQPS